MSDTNVPEILEFLKKKMLIFGRETVDPMSERCQFRVHGTG